MLTIAIVVSKIQRAQNIMDCNFLQKQKTQDCRKKCAIMKHKGASSNTTVTMSSSVKKRVPTTRRMENVTLTIA